MRRQLRAQEREIRMLQRGRRPTASAELLLSRMRAKVDDLCRERVALQWRSHLTSEPAARPSSRRAFRRGVIQFRNARCLIGTGLRGA